MNSLSAPPRVPYTLSLPISVVNFYNPINQHQESLCNDAKKDLDSKISMAWKFYKSNQNPNQSVFEIVFGERWNDTTLHEYQQTTIQRNPMTNEVEYVQQNVQAPFRAEVAAVITGSTSLSLYSAGGVACVAIINPSPPLLTISLIALCALSSLGFMKFLSIRMQNYFDQAQSERENNPTYLSWRNTYLEDAFLERDDVLSNFLCPLTGKLPDIPAYIYGCGYNEYFTVDFLRSAEFIQNNVGKKFLHTNLTCSASEDDQTDLSKKYISVENLYLDYAFLHTFAQRVNVLKNCLINKFDANENSSESLISLVHVVSKKLLEKSIVYNEAKRRRLLQNLPSPVKTSNGKRIFPCKVIENRENESKISKFFRTTFSLNLTGKTVVVFCATPDTSALKCLTEKNFDTQNDSAKIFNQFPNVDSTPFFSPYALADNK